MKNITEDQTQEILKKLNMSEDEFSKYNEITLKTFKDAFITNDFDGDDINKKLIGAALIQGLDPSQVKITVGFINTTPLHVAVNNGWDDIVMILADTLKVDVNVTNTQGETPLHLAARYGRSVDMVICLLRNSAEVAKQDGQNQTPAFCACNARYFTLYKLLDLAEQGPLSGLTNDAVRNIKRNHQIDKMRNSLYVLLTNSAPNNDDESQSIWAGSGQMVVGFWSSGFNAQKDWSKYGAKWLELIHSNQQGDASIIFQRVHDVLNQSANIHVDSIKANVLYWIYEEIRENSNIVSDVEFEYTTDSSNNANGITGKSSMELMALWRDFLKQEYNIEITEQKSWINSATFGYMG